jgi:hypothetical protein
MYESCSEQWNSTSILYSTLRAPLMYHDGSTKVHVHSARPPYYRERWSRTVSKGLVEVAMATSKQKIPLPCDTPHAETRYERSMWWLNESGRVVGTWSMSMKTVLSIPLGTRGGQLFSRADTIMYLCLCCLHRNLHSYQLDIYE